MSNSEFKNKISQFVVDLKSTGNFFSTGLEDFFFPNLIIDGVGEISLPVMENQVRELKKIGKQSHFGKGHETIMDTNIRSGFEIDSSEINIASKDWEKFLKRIIEQIKNDLGLEEYTVKAHLYKLLIYEKGDFFLRHRNQKKYARTRTI